MRLPWDPSAMFTPGLLVTRAHLVFLLCLPSTSVAHGFECSRTWPIFLTHPLERPAAGEIDTTSTLVYILLVKLVGSEITTSSYILVNLSQAHFFFNDQGEPLGEDQKGQPKQNAVRVQTSSTTYAAGYACYRHPARTTAYHVLREILAKRSNFFPQVST